MTTSMDDDDKYADFNRGKSCSTLQVLYLLEIPRARPWSPYTFLDFFRLL